MDLAELDSGCVLGVEIEEGCCVVIELPMRDDMEELILPLEFVVEPLPIFNLEFNPFDPVIVELLPSGLLMLILLFDLPADEEVDGSLPMLTLPDG